jgi:hypothetical protein
MLMLHCMVILTRAPFHLVPFERGCMSLFMSGYLITALIIGGGSARQRKNPGEDVARSRVANRKPPLFPFPRRPAGAGHRLSESISLNCGPRTMD